MEFPQEFPPEASLQQGARLFPAALAKVLQAAPAPPGPEALLRSRLLAVRLIPASLVEKLQAAPPAVKRD